MKVKFPDYNNCITNIPNSILKYFGYEEGRKTSSLLDSYLKKEYDNVVVLLLDGMEKLPDSAFAVLLLSAVQISRRSLLLPPVARTVSTNA